MPEKTPNIFEKAKLHPNSKVRHVIAVLSGKGGVGKSMVTALLASRLSQAGFRVGIMDADILGPSIPSLFRLEGEATGGKDYILPLVTSGDIQVMSSSLLLDNKEDPIVWRAPLVVDLVRQFYTDVWWHELDYLFIDMPPGTGDIALTTFQKIPVSGIVIVTSPQQLVTTIVAKAVRLAEMLKIPVLGLVENMAYVQCPHCNEKIEIHGTSTAAALVSKYHLPIHARLPLRPDMSEIISSGTLEALEVPELDAIAKHIIAL